MPWKHPERRTFDQLARHLVHLGVPVRFAIPEQFGRVRRKVTATTGVGLALASIQSTTMRFTIGNSRAPKLRISSSVPTPPHSFAEASCFAVIGPVLADRSAALAAHRPLDDFGSDFGKLSPHSTGALRKITGRWTSGFLMRPGLS